MSDLRFFHASNGLPLATVAALGGASLPTDRDAALLINAAAPLDRAVPGDVTLAEAADAADIAASRASACFVSPDDADRVPPGTVALVTADPRAAFRLVAARLHPGAVAPGSLFERSGIDPTAIIPRTARLEAGVTLDPGAIVGPRVEIGSGTTIGANATIGADTRIGRGCAIDAQVSVGHALIGDRVVIHAGARIGHGDVTRDLRDGSADIGSLRAGRPSLGRVIIQNDVEICANAAVSRGDMADTVIGEGSRVEAMAFVAGGRLIPRGSVVFR